jgi:diguanylate cyclase (GGDEF)-like protein/PAS domain S-box-containing protein
MEGIMISDGDGRIISVNPAFCLITGFAAGEVLGQPSAMLNPVFYAPQAYAARQIDIMRHGRWEGEVWNRRKNGEAYLEWQSISLIPGENPQSMRLVTVFSDVTERWRNSERIKHLAFHDPLTGLPNRTLLLERLGQLILAAGRNQRPAAVLFLDLDGFKQINDTLGHEIGDDLLKAVAQTLLDQVRQGDTVARLGGDEFVIVLDSPENAVEVERIATRIISSVGQDRVLRGNPVRVGISIGIALFPQAGASADALLAAADAAMYRAKHAGKNAWRFYQS